MVPRSTPELAELLGDLAVELQNQLDVDATLTTITTGAISLVPGARWAGISLIQGNHVNAKAPTDPLVAELDEVQDKLNEGPCLSALREHHTVYIEDTATEARWPAFAGAALNRGVQSLLSFQLFVHRENLGALNLYGGEARAFGDDSMFIGGVLAQHASIALVGARAVVNFGAALASRDAIGQAKGLLMHQRNLTGLQAFELLIKTSQEANLKLVDIARWVVDQHESGLNRS